MRYLQIVILSLAFSTLSVAETLPELGEALTVSGTPTTAQFFGGVTSDGGASYLSTVSPDKPIDILGSWQPEVAHVNTVGNFYVVVQLDESYYFQNEEGQFQGWDLDLKTLQAARSEVTLASVEQIVIIKDFALGLAGLSGKTLFVFLAYETANVPGELFYSGTPIAISVNSSVSEPSPAQPLNLSPSASISGGNQSVADSDEVPGEPVNLSGSASDSDGTVLSTQWLIDGSVVATGTSATLSLPDGSTVVTFRVTDNDGGTTDATATITVAPPPAPNLPPSASISGGNQSVTDSDEAPGEPVNLSGSASDSDGTVLSTQWLIDGSVVATGTSATLSLPDGSTVVTFRVTDNDGGTTDATATITVVPPPAPNLPPSASISGGNQSVTDSDEAPGEPVNLSGSASDSDGTVLSTQWLIDGSVVATGTSATLSLPDGSTVVTFRVTDNDGGTTDATATITVVPPPAPNLPPSASISGGNQSVTDSDEVPGEPVNLSGSASDSDGTVLSTQWLIDGSVVATGTSATLSLPDGSTVVTFRVTDNDGGTTDATATITVEAASSAPKSMKIYTESISGQIVQARCVNCHGGIAALTLVRNNVDDYINKNYNSMKDYIKQGKSNSLLSKPQGINHGGGVQLQSGSTDLNNLESFIAAIVSE